MRGLVLGLGGSNHDFSAAIAENGRLLVAIEDERLQRIKRGRTEWHARPAHDATEYCLEANAMTLGDIDAVFSCDDLEMPHDDWLDWERVTLVNHHTCHAAAAFYTSPFEAAALLVIDGHGSPLAETDTSYEVETISIGVATEAAFELAPSEVGLQRRTSSSWRYVTQNSIGWFYKIVTDALGFGSTGQGKAMGLAAFGNDRFVKDMQSFVEFGSGRFTFDPYAGFWDWLVETLAGASNPAQTRADLAFAAQEIFTDAVVRAADEAYRRHPQKALCFGGGCALNTLANSRILAETPFEELWVFPAAGDGGLAVGAALYGTHQRLELPRPSREAGAAGRSVYLGRSYGDDEIEAAIAERPVLAARPADLVGSIVDAIVDGETVGLFNGGAEMGPRALGHRSLIALPRDVAMRDHINLNVKHRESFRPLAPAVPIEHVDEYFTGVAESPFMLLVGEVRPEARRQLAAVTHVDGTARLQTVRREDNPFLHDLLLAVGERTGVPVLLNTSLNGPGEPIVETPQDALRLFIERPIDLLVLQRSLVRKYTPWVDHSALAKAHPPRPSSSGIDASTA